jgi:hypothetical protein
VALLAVLAGISACDRSPKSYQPLEPGTRWTYRVSGTAQHRTRPASKADGMSYTATVLPARSLDGQTVTPLLLNLGGRPYTSFVVEQKNGVFEVAKQPAGETEIETNDVPYCVVPYPPLQGVTCDITQTKLYENTEFTATGWSRIKAENEVVSVPAGTFKNCLRIESEKTATFDLPGEARRVTNTERITEWYAPGVGMVKQILEDRMEPSTLGWGKMTMELASFQSG